MMFTTNQILLSGTITSLVIAVSLGSVYGMTSGEFIGIELPRNYKDLKIGLCYDDGYCDYIPMYDYYNQKIDDLNERMKELREQLREKTRESSANKYLEKKIWIEDGHIHWYFHNPIASQAKASAYQSNEPAEWMIPINTVEDTIRNHPDEYRKTIRSSVTGITWDSYKFDPFVKGIFPQIDKEFTIIKEEMKKRNQSDAAIDEQMIMLAVLNVQHLTTYQKDIGQFARFADETLSRGGGDCEDLAILIADLLISSKYTKDWTMKFYLMDSDNPSNPEQANHVILWIDTGNFRTFIEPTVNLSQDLSSLEYAKHWNNEGVRGWAEDITRKTPI